jgi:hypothetical protein
MSTPRSISRRRASSEPFRRRSRSDWPPRGLFLRRSRGGLPFPVGDSGPRTTWTMMLLRQDDVLLQTLLVGEELEDRLLDDVHEVEIELVDAGVEISLADELDAQHAILLSMARLRD